ncbi:MAG: glycosyltransferase family 2 protein [Proteobacteria bacterium]|nr:glycosyltransferase family 2 protein [Pseudomonadota bacterium]
MVDRVLLSVIIPSFNRSSQLPELLKSLAAQTIDHHQSELIIVDDGSTDSTWSLLQAFAGTWSDGWLRVLTQKNQGQAAARQHGVSASRGEYLLFLDDDMEPTNTELLTHHLNFHLQSKLATVALGAVLAPLGSKFRPAFEYFYERSIARLYAGFLASEIKPGGTHFFSAHVSLPKELFLRAGGFNKDFRQAEDRELGLRLDFNCGANFVFLSHAAAYHHSPTGKYAAFLRRARQYGHYDLLIARLHPGHPEIHPQRQLECPNRGKRWLALATWTMPKLFYRSSYLLVPLAQFFHRIGLRRFAIAFCSILYCIHYTYGYLSSWRTHPELNRARDSDHDAA